MNYVNWFEIPVSDIERARKFYANVLDVKLELEEFGPTKMAVFPSTEKGSVHGALVQGATYVPNHDGVLIYLNGGNDLSTPLSRVKAAGGEVIQEKTAIGPHGYMAVFRDTEGNRLAFHSPN